MMNVIQRISPIQCLRAFHILVLAKLLSLLLLLQSLQTAAVTVTATTVTIATLQLISYYCATDHSAADI
jgi:hypothetical protein